MRYIGLLNEDGDIIEEGFGLDNVDATAMLGRQLVSGERSIVGQGETEDEARENALEWCIISVH
jgi:hypothetical protein